MNAAIGPAGPADRADWDAFLATRPEGDILQLWAWGEVRGRTGEPAARILARGPSGAILGIAQALVRPTMLGRTVLYVPHGPVWDRSAADAPAILAALVGGLRDLARDRHGIVVKVDPRALPGPTAGAGSQALAGELVDLGLRPARFDLQARRTSLVELDAERGARRTAWSGSARNRASRAAREGTTTAVSRSVDDAAIDDFVALLAGTAGRGGVRTPSGAFLRDLAAAFVPGAGWYLAVARAAGRPIAGMAVLRLADRAYYLYGALDRAAPPHSYGAYAAMAAIFAAIAADGVRTFDLWGVDDPDDRRADPTWAGFGAFKRQFGGEDLRHPGTFDLVVDPVVWLARDLRERLVGRR